MTNTPHIQESDISHLANLARIRLTENEVTQFTKNIQSIVGFIDVVNDTDVNEELLKQEGFAPVNTTRKDEEKENDYMTSPEIIAGAPASQDNYVKVKKIIGDN